MISLAEELQLREDQFAFYFRTKQGVEANELGTFLQRAATIARKENAELRVTAVQPGSVAVIFQAFISSPVARAAVDEFMRQPIATTAAGVAIVGAIVGSIVWAMSPDAGATPLAKAGADVVQSGSVEQIEIVTIRQTIVVMDAARADQVRHLQQRHAERPRMSYPMVRQLADDARSGMLTGTVLDVAGELHFRPHGQRFLVPIEVASAHAAAQLFPNHQVRIRGDLLTHNGQPNGIVVHWAEPYR
jgi:hypothetical protein